MRAPEKKTGLPVAAAAGRRVRLAATGDLRARHACLPPARGASRRGPCALPRASSLRARSADRRLRPHAASHRGRARIARLPPPRRRADGASPGLRRAVGRRAAATVPPAQSSAAGEICPPTLVKPVEHSLMRGPGRGWRTRGHRRARRRRRRDTRLVPHRPRRPRRASKATAVFKLGGPCSATRAARRG